MIKTQILFLLSIAQIGFGLITFKLQSSRPYCLYFPGNGLYNLEYLVSGKNDQKVKMEMYQGHQLLLQKEGVSQFYVQQNFRDEKVKVCFTRLDKQEKDISFDYYIEDDPIKQMIDKKDLLIVSKSINDAIKNLQQVGKNQELHIERDQINRVILQKSETHIKWAGIIKIVFLLTSALLQLWIMKSFFKQNSIPYQSVGENE